MQDITYRNHRLALKWLNTNKHLWCEKIVDGHKLIVIKNPTKAPNYVKYHVSFRNSFSMGGKRAAEWFINAVDIAIRNQKPPKKKAHKSTSFRHVENLLYSEKIVLIKNTRCCLKQSNL